VLKEDRVKTQHAFGQCNIDSMVHWSGAAVEFDVRSLYVL
jgi:hypothetical protein